MAVQVSFYRPAPGSQDGGTGWGVESKRPSHWPPVRARVRGAGLQTWPGPRAGGALPWVSQLSRRGAVRTDQPGPLSGQAEPAGLSPAGPGGAL